MIATLLFAGPRISEALGLRWRDVDLAGDWLTVSGTKTGQAQRKVRIGKGLHVSLASAISPAAIDPDALLFPTRTGAQLSPENFRNRTLAATVKRANENLVRAGQAAATEAHAPLAAPYVLLEPVRGRRVPRDGHGRDGPRRPGAFTRRVRSGDAS